MEISGHSYDIKTLDFILIRLVKKKTISALMSTSISLEITNTLDDCDNGYIEIRCVANGGLLHVAELRVISLRTLERDVAYFRSDGVSGRKELAKRSGVLVSSLIRDAGLSFLSIRVKGSMVIPQKDKGPYQCVFNSFDVLMHMDLS